MSDAVQCHRHDKGPALRLAATPVEVRPDGRRIYEGTATFGDILKPYPDLDPPRVEFSPADEVMSPAALASMEGAIFTGGPRRRDWDGSVTLPADHAPNLLDLDTAGDAIEGAVLRAWRQDGETPEDPPRMRVRVIAYTRAMIQLIEGGAVELSPGFRCDEDKTPGTFRGQPYDLVQRRHRFDHLNVVHDARGRDHMGRGARLDSNPAVITTTAPPSYPLPETPRMPDLDLLLADDTNATPSPLAALTVRLDALSPEGLALMKQMSPEDQAVVVAAMPPAGAVLPADGQPPALAAAAPAEMDLAATVADLVARVAALEGADATEEATVTDAAPDPEATPAAAKKDRKPAMPTAPLVKFTTGSIAAARPTFDAAAVIAQATREATVAATAQYNADAELVGMVRKDGHSDVHTTTDAAARMLGVVKTHTPLLAPIAEAELKVGRMDSLRAFYLQAEAIRRDSVARSQEDHVLGETLGAPVLESGPVTFRLPGQSPRA